MFSKIFRIRRQELLKNILKNINKNLLLLKSKREIERQKKRLSYLNNYKLSSIVKRTQYNFDNSINFNKDNRDNRNKQSYININLKDCKRI